MAATQLHRTSACKRGGTPSVNFDPDCRDDTVLQVYMSSLAMALSGLESVLVGRVANPEPLTAEHEVVDAIPDFRG